MCTGVSRPGQLKSSGVDRFSDRIALGVLTRAFPPELVDQVVAECGRVEQRTRLLPARVVVYCVLAMCLFFGQATRRWPGSWSRAWARSRRWATAWRVPTTAAIGRARLRLGPEPLRWPSGPRRGAGRGRDRQLCRLVQQQLDCAHRRSLLAITSGSAAH